MTTPESVFGPEIDVSHLIAMAETAHLVTSEPRTAFIPGSIYEEMLYGPAYQEATRVMGGWACAIVAAESYLLDPDDDSLSEPYTDMSFVVAGALERVRICAIWPDSEIPRYGEADRSLSLVFEPVVIDLSDSDSTTLVSDGDTVRLVSPETLFAVPLLPRHVEIDPSDQLVIRKLKPLQE